MKEHDHIHHHEHHHHDDVHTEHCECGCGAEHGDHFEQTKKDELTRAIIGAVFFIVGYVLAEFTALPEYAYLICFLISYVSVGFNVVKQAVVDILNGRIFGECFLMSAASLGAFAIKEYSEGCAVMLLYAIGEYIQGAALYKSRKGLRALADEHGFAHSHSNSETERFISRFAKYYTPVICLIAVLIIVVPPIFINGEWKDWIYRGLSALVIGCPCAIVISVPLAFSCAVGACTKKGIFVHCSDALERLYKKEENIENEIVITNQSAAGIAFAEKAAKKAVMISRENIFFALAVKAVVLVLVIFLEKEVPMWLAEFSDVGVALLAILNSLRALSIRNK